MFNLENNILMDPRKNNNNGIMSHFDELDGIS
jgi:hypothetical protein